MKLLIFFVVAPFSQNLLTSYIISIFLSLTSNFPRTIFPLSNPAIKIYFSFSLFPKIFPMNSIAVTGSFVSKLEYFLNLNTLIKLYLNQSLVHLFLFHLLHLNKYLDLKALHRFFF